MGTRNYLQSLEIDKLGGPGKLKGLEMEWQAFKVCGFYHFFGPVEASKMGIEVFSVKEIILAGLKIFTNGDVQKVNFPVLSSGLKGF